MQPASAEEVPPNTRLCAYWSQQYRCLYPGVAATSLSPEHEQNSKFVVVEFDDGDSGRIAIEDIRFLMNDYPLVGKYFKLLRSHQVRSRRCPHYSLGELSTVRIMYKIGRIIVSISTAGVIFDVL